MANFSTAYAKARTVITTARFAADWQKLIDTEGPLKSALGAESPEVAHGGAFDKLRDRLDKAARKGIGALFTGNGLDEVILKAARESDKDTAVGEKAATLKMLKHLYLVRQKGSQDVWVYSPPKAFKKWVFDEIKGSDADSKKRLQQETEVYSAKDRAVMADALQEAAAWCQKVQLALSKPEGEAAVKRWFTGDAGTAQQLTQAIDTLRDGFKKIDTLCRSGKLVFSDEPGDRHGGGWKDWAFVYKQEAMNVVYLQGAFLKAGNSGNKTMCALTIIHELTHKLLNTQDHRYDYDGLKPGRDIAVAKAIDNADSWGYFAADAVGMLSTSDRKRVLG